MKTQMSINTDTHQEEGPRFFASESNPSVLILETLFSDANTFDRFQRLFSIFDQFQRAGRWDLAAKTKLDILRYTDTALDFADAEVHFWEDHITMHAVDKLAELRAAHQKSITLKVLRMRMNRALCLLSLGH